MKPKFVVSKPVGHGFRVLGPASPKAAAIARAALEKVRRDRS